MSREEGKYRVVRRSRGVHETSVFDTLDDAKAFAKRECSIRDACAILDPSNNVISSWSLPWLKAELVRHGREDADPVSLGLFTVFRLCRRRVSHRGFDSEREAMAYAQTFSVLDAFVVLNTENHEVLVARCLPFFQHRLTVQIRAVLAPRPHNRDLAALLLLAMLSALAPDEEAPNAERVAAMIRNQRGEPYVPGTHGDTRDSICQEEFKEGDDVVQLECGHVFHKDCFEELVTHGHTRCPNCRNEVPQS